MLYPNGTASSPGKIAPNQRFIISNPFPGYYVSGRVEIYHDGMWAKTNSYNDSDRASGVDVNQINSTQLVVSSGNTWISCYANADLSPFTLESMEWKGGLINPKPFRVLIYTIGKIS